MNQVAPGNAVAKRPYEGADGNLPIKRRLRASTQAQARSVPIPASATAAAGTEASRPTDNIWPEEAEQSPILLQVAQPPIVQPPVVLPPAPYPSPISPFTSTPPGIPVSPPSATGLDDRFVYPPSSYLSPEAVIEEAQGAAHSGTFPVLAEDQPQENCVAGEEHVQTPATQQGVEGLKIWAKRRQGLCDALPYFKAHQGSLYTVNLVPFGLLIAREARSRDQFDGQVIITSVGGGRVRDEDSGQMIRVQDQEENRSLKALRRCKDERIPIAVIAGDDHPLYPVKPPRPYCVLDFFQVTDIWAEKQVYLNKDACRVWCVRLEKIDLHSPSWWDPSTTTLSSDDVQQRSHSEAQTCRLCAKSSKVIYTQGWTCLNHKCSLFLQTEGIDMDFNALQYTSTFISERTPFVGPLPSLVPPLPSEDMLNSSHGSEKIFRVGIVCPDCGCCSSRRSWAAWECENCDYRLPGRMSQYPKDLLGKERLEFEKATARMRKRNGLVHEPVALRIDSACVVSRTLDVGGKYTATQYLLPGENDDKVGSVTVLHANEAICSGRNGPHEIFDELCTQDIGLRRNPVTRNGAKTEVWTRHFAKNWGAPYKFAVTVQSKAFDEAPPSILKAIHRMLWAGKTAARTAKEWLSERGEQNPVPEGDVVFNELLSLGYMEDDRISYHDDGEKELGPTVATLSLGCPAIMSFRPKKKANIKTSAPPKGPTGEYGEVLSLPLLHGDLVVMHGTGIHKLYDHKVDPQGARRFALTCRYIDPATMSSKEDQDAAITKGTIPADSFQKYAYDGHDSDPEEA